MNASRGCRRREQRLVVERVEQRVAERAAGTRPRSGAWVDFPPAPWDRVMCSSRSLRAGRRRRCSIASSTSCSALGCRGVTLAAIAVVAAPGRRRPRESAVVVVRRAGALARDHAGADRAVGRAGRAEHLALPRLDHALEHLAALARLRVGDPDARHLEAQLGVPVRELGSQLQRALGDEAQAAPLEGWCAAPSSRRSPPARAGCPRSRTTRLYWFSTSAAALAQLAHDHVHALEDVERLEARQPPPACRSSRAMKS